MYKTKKKIAELFDVPIKTLNNDLIEMRRLSQFESAILRPTYKRVYISVEGYRKFLQFKQEKREKAM